MKLDRGLFWKLAFFSVITLIVVLLSRQYLAMRSQDFVDVLPKTDCFFPVYPLYCLDFSFKPEENSLELSLRKHSGEERSFVVTELSLVQGLPIQKMRCWLDVNGLSPESLFSDPPGLHIRTSQAVKIRLDCTPFEQKDIEKGVWVFNQTTYVIEDGTLAPAQLYAEKVVDSDMSSEGYIRINYLSCGQNNREWCET